MDSQGNYTVVGIKMHKDVWKAARRTAREMGLSMAAFIRMAIYPYVVATRASGLDEQIVELPGGTVYSVKIIKKGKHDRFPSFFNPEKRRTTGD